MPEGNAQDLIKTATGGEPVQPTAGAAGQPPATAPEPVGAEAEVMTIAQQLAGLMMANPQIAERIADVLENFGKEETGVVGNREAPLAGAAPSDAPAPQPSPIPVVDPVTQARMAEIERQLADYEVDRELARVGTRYNQLRPHFGDLLPESVEEKALLQKVNEIITGRASPFDVALAVYLLEKATAGEGTMRDRILASAANTVGKPPAVEGRGGGIATGEGSPDVSKMSTTQLMDYIKGALASKRSQPG